jgi:hypothetical protein
MGYCGFKALEFWIIWLSVTSAGLVCSSIFKLDTFEAFDNIEGRSQGSIFDTEAPTKPKDSEYELFFFIYSLALAFFFTIAVRLVLHYCPSKKRIASRGRKMYMLRLVQWIRATVLVATIAWVYNSDLMEHKVGNELLVGWVLLGCEYADVLIEGWILRKKLHASSKPTVFFKMFTELMCNVMVAAQMVNIDELKFLYTAVAFTVVFSLCIAYNQPDPTSENVASENESREESLIEKYEFLPALVGFIGGLGLALWLGGRRSFKEGSDISVYAVLFAFNFALPITQKKYEHVEIEPEYEHTYHRRPSQSEMAPVGAANVV